MATLNEIANILGISKSTVSRVINNDPNVKYATRERVWKVIRELNYKPNIIARSMITGSLPLVLVIVGDMQNHYFSKTFIGIEKVLMGTGYMPVVYNSMYDVAKEKELIQMARDYQFAGMIPMTGVASQELKECIQDVKCPLVFINRKFDDLEFDEIGSDDFDASYKATSELIDNGHRRIAYLSGSKKSSIAETRFRGFCKALEDNGIALDENLVFKGSLDMTSGYELAGKIFNELGIKAICSNNFLMALGVLRYGARNGRTVLKDFEIACCEMVPDLYFDSGMIFVGADLEAIGEKAGKILLKRIAGANDPKHRICFSASKVFNPLKA